MPTASITPIEKSARALSRSSCSQHFRGNLDNWDPALVDSLSVDRRVIAFDNGGVGGSSGTTPNNFEEMATTPSRLPRRWAWSRSTFLAIRSVASLPKRWRLSGRT